MHINRVYLSGLELWVSYDLKVIDGLFVIVATFTKDGGQVKRIHNITDGFNGTPQMIAKLLDDTYAREKGFDLYYR